MNLRVLIANYIPSEFVQEKKNTLFETLVALLGKDGVSKNPIVDQLFGFLSAKENMERALEWLEGSKIVVDGKELFELSKSHKYSIVRIIFKSKHFSLEQKQALLDKVGGEDISDQGEQLRASCYASTPDPEVKAKVWDDITNPECKDSLYIKRSKMGGFYASDQMEIIEPYFDKFYDVLTELHEKYTYKEFDTFFHNMLPRMKITDSHIVKLVSLKLQTSDNEQMFATTLQDGIEILMRSQSIKAFALKEFQASQAKL